MQKNSTEIENRHIYISQLQIIRIFVIENFKKINRTVANQFCNKII